MPLKDKLKAKKKKGAAVAVAHIVSPAHKLAAAKRGEEVKSLCGDVTIKGDPVADATVCQKCVLAQFDVDDMRADAHAQSRFEAGQANAQRERAAGHAEGVRVGRADSMREIREAAERRASEVKQSA